MSTIREISKKKTREKYLSIYREFRSGKTVKEIALARGMKKEGVYTAIRRHLSLNNPE